MTQAESRTHIITQLTVLYGADEAAAIARWLLESLGIEHAGKSELTEAQTAGLEDALPRLLAGEPLQYVLQEAWFGGLRLHVDQRVLIPRPETEELVEWVISHCKFPLDQLTILDIGTGSGCIPLALKKRLGADVHSIDASLNALEVAAFNAGRLRLPIQLHHDDILQSTIIDALPSFDFIISNPPYIPESDAADMHQNVLAFEPHQALFVPNQDPLLFYRVIADISRRKLKTGGQLFFEIHESAGRSVAQLLQELGYQSECKKDMQGKDRMLRAWLP